MAGHHGRRRHDRSGDSEPGARLAQPGSVAHLCLQPTLLRKFIATAPTQHAVVTVAASLAGTHSLARLAGASAREAAEAGRADFAKAVDEAVPALRAADLSATAVTMPGPIRLADYLVTRCAEAVVHGRDLVDPVRPRSSSPRDDLSGKGGPRGGASFSPDQHDHARLCRVARFYCPTQ